jgi:hypothetical protein
MKKKDDEKVTLTMDDEIVQMKLITGETVLAAFSPNNDQIEDSFILMCVLEMVPFDSYEEDDDDRPMEYFLLRPWITYVEDVRMEVSVNPTNVIYMTTPATKLKEQYFKSLKEISKSLGKQDAIEKGGKSETESENELGSSVIAFRPRDTEAILLKED